MGYDWDALGQLVSVRSEETTITYAYGISGMRELVSVETSGAATSWTKSVWDGQRLAAELDSDGTRYTYVWGPERTPLALEVTRSGQDAVTYAYHTDALGSVVAITSPSGAVVASYAYDPYGALTQVGGSDAALAERNPLRYRAYYHDTVTGHYYLPARYYDPDTMRFLSPDPAPPSAGDPLSLNRYAYCVGDPVDMSDPTGEIADWDGDGRVSAYEASDHASRHTSNPRLRKYFRARSLALYQARSSDRVSLQFAGRRAAEAAELLTGPIPDDLQQLMPDESPFGRHNLNCRLSRPDCQAYGWTTFGGASDLVGLAGKSVNLGAAAFSALIEGGVAYGYKRKQWRDGEITFADYLMSYVTAAPVVGSAFAVGTTVVGPALPDGTVHWAKPYAYSPYGGQ